MELGIFMFGMRISVSNHDLVPAVCPYLNKGLEGNVKFLQLEQIAKCVPEKVWAVHQEGNRPGRKITELCQSL